MISGDIDFRVVFAEVGNEGPLGRLWQVKRKRKMKAWGPLLTLRERGIGEETPKETKKYDLSQTILAKT